ncbi:hypothetical protein D3C80_1575190 [compost metagenome]
MVSVCQSVRDGHGGTGAFAADHVPIEFNLNDVTRRVIRDVYDIRRADGCSIPHHLVGVAVSQRRHEFDLGKNLFVLIRVDQFVVNA